MEFSKGVKTYTEALQEINGYYQKSPLDILIEGAKLRQTEVENCAKAMKEQNPKLCSDDFIQAWLNARLDELNQLNKILNLMMEKTGEHGNIIQAESGTEK